MNPGEENNSKFIAECFLEIENFHQIFRQVLPTSGDVPQIEGIEAAGKTFPLNGVLGGDHIIYIDFNKRYNIEEHVQEALKAGDNCLAAKLSDLRFKAGFLISDVSGHQITDALLNAMLHQAFLLGVQYELKYKGEITTELFENINTRFYNTSTQFKFITMLYGEISSNGTFRFLSAAHPRPIVFSREFNRIMFTDREITENFPPIGKLPSRKNWENRSWRTPLKFKKDYQVNEITLMGSGDILILYTDGLSEHQKENGESFFPQKLEELLSRVKDLPATEICTNIHQEMLSFAPPADDISLIVIKKS